MKLAYETLEIWQLAMKLVEITHSLRKQFPREERYGLWGQLVNAVESTPLLIAEGYGRRTPPDRAHFMDQAIASNLEAKTAYQISVRKGYVTRSQFEKLISPLIEKIHFKTIGFKKYLLKEKTSERSDQPPPPRPARDGPITRLPQAEPRRQSLYGAKRFRGFTLIEILVVVGILGIIAIIGSNMFFTILKGSTKTRILAEVKQNGGYALGVMERMIRNAKEITSGCTLGMTTIKIKNPDEGETEFACEPDKISSNSASLTSNQVKPVSGSCYFDCQPGEKGVRPDTATIKFSLTQAATGVRPEEQARVDFQTTVTLRNY